MTLRPYQTRCIDEARNLVRAGKRSICIVAPTGAGKTIIGATIATSAATKGNVLWLAHRQELVDQARSKLPESVRVATVQGLLASGERPPATVLVWDEAHHVVADQWRQLADHYRDALRIGLTATPERGDGKPLGDVFDGLAVAASYSELLAGGWIVPCEVVAPDSKAGKLAMPVVEAVQRYSEGRQTIVFCATVAESRDVAAALCPEAVSVDGATPGAVRLDAVNAFRARQYRTLANVYVLSEGFDAPEAAVCILARGAGHASTYLQMVGRVLRPAPGKGKALLVDLCGSVNEHGFPTDDRRYSLDGDAIQRKDGKRPIVWQCKRCGHCVPAPPWNRRCPACNATLPEPKPLVVERRRLERKERDQIATTETRAAEFAKLCAIANERGYKPGWAAFRYKARFGVWPRRARA